MELTSSNNNGGLKNIRTTHKDIIEKAIKMHKEEIEDAYWEGGQDVPSNGKRCEDYYQKTYGK